MCGFDNPYSLHMVTDPFSDHLDMLRPNEIGFVEYHHVCKADLAQFEQVQSFIIAICKNPDGVDDAGNAVDLQQPFVPRIQEGHYDPLGVGYPTGLQDHVIYRFLACEELFE